MLKRIRMLTRSKFLFCNIDMISNVGDGGQRSCAKLAYILVS